MSNTLSALQAEPAGQLDAASRAYVEVVEFQTGQVVERIDVTDKSARSVERIMRGMLINMDRDRFCVREAAKPA